MHTPMFSAFYRKSVSLFVLLSLLCAYLPFFSSVAVAQEAGVSLTPIMIEETLDPGVTEDFSLKIKNLKNSAQTFYFFTRNIKTVTDAGAPVFMKDYDEATGYELSDWIQIGVSEMTLEGRQEISLPITITVPEDASPGSHFGGIFASVDPPKIERSGAAVGYQVASIVSIRVSGDTVEDAMIREFSTANPVYASQSVDFTLRIENKGNVLVRPTGPLEIYNMFGKKVGDLVFNEGQNAVFPKTVRVYDDIHWEGDNVGFGRYEARVSPVYGELNGKKTITSTVTFWILPMNIIVPALGVLAFIILIIFVSVRLYVKRSLARMNYGRRVIRQRRRGVPSAMLLMTVISLAVTVLFLIALLLFYSW